jgi:hypothetical protein
LLLQLGISLVLLGHLFQLIVPVLPLFFEFFCGVASGTLASGTTVASGTVYTTPSLLVIYVALCPSS